jgi:uncharacterized protein (TIGR00369 family)
VENEEERRMPQFVAQDPNFEARVRGSFARQSLNRTIGASLIRVAPGEVEIEVPFKEELGQQHGFIHGGIVAAIVDSACGYAALSLTPSTAEVLTVEFKINFLAPARGERLIARGRVSRPGRTVSVCHGDVFATGEGKEKLVATMLATIMTVSSDREGQHGGTPAQEGRAFAHDRHAPGQHGSDRMAHGGRRWCVCRGRGLAQRFRDIAGIAR